MYFMSAFNRTISELKRINFLKASLAIAAFNRTISELKLWNDASLFHAGASFNRTISELKLICGANFITFTGLLIEPFRN